MYEGRYAYEIVAVVEVIVEVVEVIVEVMGAVEVMEVTLLFVEVTSFQKSKSLRVVPNSFSTLHSNLQQCLVRTDGRTDGETFSPNELSGDS